MRHPFASVIPAALCAFLVGCVSTEDPEGLPDDRADRLVLQETVADPAALDSCDPMSGSTDICCIEGTMLCPTTGQEWIYVCANRAKAASQCASQCAVACVRSEFNICQ